MKRSSYSIKILSACLVLMAVLQQACVPPKPADLFPPNVAAGCSDGILNQGEYFIDCGGPVCQPCPPGNPTVYAEIDSTWIDPAKKSNARFWTSQYVHLTYTANLIKVQATDTFNAGDPQYRQLTFYIDRDFGKGIHEIDEMYSDEKYFANPPAAPSGMVELERGIITITNIDKVNRLISGEFEFISKPQISTEYRIVFYNGRFTDIPMDEAP